MPVPVVATATPAPDAAVPTAPDPTPATATAADPTCTDPPTAPAGASPAAVAYVAALDHAWPAWLVISNRITAQGDTVYGPDVEAQWSADDAFTLEIEAIDWPDDVRPAASTFIYAMVAFVNFLGETIAKHTIDAGYTAKDDELLDARAAASATLRTALQLPASGCTIQRA